MRGLMLKLILPMMAIFIFQFRYRGIGGYGATSPVGVFKYFEYNDLLADKF